MAFITQGKANIKYLLIVVLAAAVAGGIVFAVWSCYQKEMVDLNKSAEINKQQQVVEDGTTISEVSPTSTPLSTCTDSDGGKNYYVKGTAKDSSITKIESCYDPAKGEVGFCSGSDCTLEEYYCGSDNKVYVQQNYKMCIHGCQDGACIGTKVLSPSGGEQWERGNAYEIIWNSNGLDYPISVKAITEDYGEEQPSCQEIFGPDNVDPSLGKYYLEIPSDACLARYKIQICKYDEVNFEASICDESDNYFSIAAKEVKEVLVPRHNFYVSTNDITDNWSDAKDYCESLGNGWKLPTMSQLKIIYQNKEAIGGFVDDSYWTSDISMYIWFGSGLESSMNPALLASFCCVKE